MNRPWTLALLALAAAGWDKDGLPGDTPSGGQAPGRLLREAPRITRTREGFPGDPVNLALFGTRAEIVAAFHAAGWCPADPITVRSGVRISTSVVFDHPYPQAPVSSLYLCGRKQDLAFQQPSGKSPRTRHHVRLWCTGETDSQGRPLWLGAATYDRSVGRSATTGKLTHHIAPDVDCERDKLLGDLGRTNLLQQLYPLADFHPIRHGHNGGGDPYFTDGALMVGVLAPVVR
jgi:hypothetical protein